MPKARGKDHEQADRRRKVAELYRARLSQSEIGRRLGLSKATVCRDLQAVIAEDREAAKVHIAEWRARELADLERMETDATVRYRETLDHKWIETRLKIKARRTALLGLDAPAKVEQSGPEGVADVGTVVQVLRALEAAKMGDA